ncbi:MAG TPA: SUMF1/EgtB/PvdO family nonheme iron enzyme [Ktedonobacterales bacterium]|nr:SUMF1/EgtB/PvdO family nonheme iron enzyme [Ktedonobacterales bacterium]
MITPARPGRIPDPIFVSHSHLDNDWCREFVATLTAADWDVWYDEKGLHGGAEWLNVIQAELSARPNFMPILTPDAWASKWVQREIGLAMLENKEIIPVLHTDTPQAGGFLKLIQWINVIGLPAPIAAAKVAQEMGYPLDRRDQPPPPPPDDKRFPRRLASLGYTKRPNGDDIVIIPPLCSVPAGPFLMGSDKRRDPQAQDNELPQHTVALAAYQIARYPVTVAEYACAVRVGALKDPPKVLSLSWKIQLERFDHPVVNVSWNEAAAYAVWLAQTTRQIWRQPTEAEWEKATRGTDGRVYPWGDAWDKTRTNTSDGGPGRTTPVGIYPGGDSPYGAQDLAGNVWEWCSSLYKDRYPYNLAASETLDDSPNVRVIGGGSWSDDPRIARAAYRNWSTAGVRSSAVGFRLVCEGDAGTI